MPRLKRTRDDAELDASALEPAVPPQHAETLAQLRSMWEFASLMQYIYLFGHVVKIDDNFDIEDLEAECLRPEPSEKLASIALQLLKYVSSHRGLTLDIFDEYTRRQYLAKAPARNPFGDEEAPAKFNDFDAFTKIRVMQQLSTWTFGNADRIRGMMPQDDDHLNWRMEPLGWDKEDRAYFVLDDNRLYRRSDEPPPPPSPKTKAKPKPKAKSKPAPKKPKTKGTRSSKRRKVEEPSEDEAEEEDVAAGAQDDTIMTNGDQAGSDEEAGFGFTSKTWECIAITLEEYQEFLASIFRSRDANEKQLRKRIEEDVLPIIEKRAEALRQKQLKKIRELENLEKMATAKRSGRLANKAEKEKQDREEREAEEKRQAELKMAHEEQERQRRIEEGHESRRLTREQRLKEREVKRILHEEELAKIDEQATRASSQDPASDAANEASKRISERQLKTQKAQHKKELERMAEEEDKWYFDCVKCGMHGDNLDDGSHSIACERCNVWQHSKCHGFSPKQAEKDGFHFICSTCKRKEEDAKKPKIAPLKLSKNRPSESPEVQKSGSRPSTANANTASTPRGALPDHVARQLDGEQQSGPSHRPAAPFGQITNGPNLSPYSQAQGQSGSRYPPVGNFAPHPQHTSPPQQPWQGSPLPPPQRPPSSGYAGSPPARAANGYASQHQHQQQHQNVHQNAVTTSGAHPTYLPQQYQQQPQMNGYSPRAPSGMYAMEWAPQQYYQANTPYTSQQPQQRPGSQGQMAHGAQSPVKKPKQSSPPQQHQYQNRPTSGHNGHLSSAHSPHAPQNLQRNLAPSPGMNFPPPQQTYQQHGAPSPTKASPTSHRPQQPIHHQPAQPQMAQTPKPQPQAPPPSSSGPAHYQSHQTPQTTQPQQAHPSPANSNANAIAADGMSGPWPEGSKAIPQKQDRSPAPLPPPSSMASQVTQSDQPVQSSPAPVFSSPGSNETKVAGPPSVAPPVALSPTQQMQEQAQATGPASVPVKKMPVADMQTTSGMLQGETTKGAEESQFAATPKAEHPSQSATAETKKTEMNGGRTDDQQHQ